MTGGVVMLGRINSLWRRGRRPEEWKNDAACREAPDPEIFWPIHRKGARLHKNQTADALAVCRICLVRDECLAYALNGPENDGIWGGTTERQRETLRRDKRKADRGR